MLILMFAALIVSAQAVDVQPQAEISWKTFDEVAELQKTAPRKVFVDYTTAWCGWCKKMEATTFSNPVIVNYVNANYYAIKFNAEGPDSVKYKEVVYKNPGYKPEMANSRNSAHELAVKLMNGRLSYPTIGFLDEKMDILSNVPGYKTPDDFLNLLLYFGENIHMSTPWDVFQKNFQETYDTIPDNQIIEWHTFSELAELMKKEPRKIIVSLHTEWSFTSKIMFAKTFTNPVIAEYINKNYYAVRFDAISKDSVVYNGKTFYNPPGQTHPFHQLGVEFLQGKMSFPAVIFIDKNYGLLSAVPGYFAPKAFEPVMSFFFDEAYKEKQWPDYVKNFVGKVE